MKMRYRGTPYLVLISIITILLLIFSVSTIIDIVDMASAIKQEDQAYEAHVKKLDELRIIAGDEDEYERSIAFMNKLVPQKANDSEIVNQINQLCKRIGADLVEVGFGGRFVNGDVSVMPLKLRFRCEFYPLIELIRGISSGERLIRIDEISIAKDSGSRGGLSIDISARAFYR